MTHVAGADAKGTFWEGETGMLFRTELGPETKGAFFGGRRARLCLPALGQSPKDAFRGGDALGSFGPVRDTKGKAPSRG